MSVEAQMREDWNRRARQDAHYYVAFGSQNQSEDEFFATARELVQNLEIELKRLGPGSPRARRALEIGCGPGRLLKPLSRWFGEIHGVDVSDEMVARARRNLAGIPHAHVHVSPGADLRQFADESFDFVYSYAVFQHIPDREVVWSYLREARRVLKTGGLLWFQVNGLPVPPPGDVLDTWAGVRFTAADISHFADANDFQLYALEGVHTQYMCASMRKRPEGWFANCRIDPAEAAQPRIAVIANPLSAEPAVPCAGRFACASLWIENLPEEVGLNHLEVEIGGKPGSPNCIAAAQFSGRTQVNVLLPEGLPTGLIPVRARWRGQWLTPEAVMRVRPPSPLAPRLESVSDGLYLLLGTRIRTGLVRLSFLELADPATVRAEIDGVPVNHFLIHRVDPRTGHYHFAFELGESVTPGAHVLAVSAGRTRFPDVVLEVEQKDATPV